MSLSIDQRIERVFKPALLYDATDALLEGELLLRELATDHPDRRRLWWRTLALRARFDAAGALGLLDASDTSDDPQTAAQLRAAALLERGRGEAAAAVVANHARERSASWTVLRAQLAMYREDMTGAVQRLDRMLATDDTDVELRARALVFRMHASSQLGNRETVQRDGHSLITLCEQNGAVVSTLMVRLLTQMLSVADPPGLQTLVSALLVEELKQRIGAGVPGDQAKLGPIPFHVHALFVRHRIAPSLLVSHVVNMGGLQHRAGQRGEAYVTFYYADQLGARLLEARWSDELARSLRAYGELLGESELAEQMAYLKMRSDTFLRSMRP